MARLCIGGKMCRRVDCKNRCKSWFTASPELEVACRGRCDSNDTSFTKENFLCSGDWIDDRDVIALYGYDPCPKSGGTIDEVLDPLGDRAREDERLQQIMPLAIAIVVLIAAGLAIMYVMKR